MAIVDISGKDAVRRVAEARGTIHLLPETINRIKRKEIVKGDVLAVAEIAAIGLVKKTPDILVFCHQIPIENVQVDFVFGKTEIKTRVKVKASAKTGVEMEALNGVYAALATIWDMTKYLEKDEKGQYPSTSITDIMITKKTKGDNNG